MKPTSTIQKEDEARAKAAKNAFQDAVYDAFKKTGAQPSASERALLRDRLANISCPRDVADDLRGERFN